MSGSVLVADDDEDALLVARRALERAGFGPVESARDGVEALERLGLGERSGSPDELPALIFLDLKMPRIDGLQALRAIRADARTRTIPIVVVSASDRDADIGESYALGANGYLVKHRNREAPGHELAEAARYWLELNSVRPAGRPRRP